MTQNKKGERLARIGDPELGDGPDQFIAPHGFGVDTQGNLYVGEVSYTVYGRRMDSPKTFRCFRKSSARASQFQSSRLQIVIASGSEATSGTTLRG